MNVTPDSVIAFAAFVVILALGWLWHEARHAPLLDDPGLDPDVAALPCLDAAAVVLVEQLMSELEQALREAAR